MSEDSTEDGTSQDQSARIRRFSTLKTRAKAARESSDQTILDAPNKSQRSKRKFKPISSDQTILDAPNKSQSSKRKFGSDDSRRSKQETKQEEKVSKTMGGTLGLVKPDLSQFQKNKLLHEYYTFFDLNKDGALEWKDFDLARQKICELSGWKIGTDKFMRTQELFVEIWRRLSDEADEDNDGKVTADEWVRMWEMFHKEGFKRNGRKNDKEKKEVDRHEEYDLPDWLKRYIEYKFNLYDRTGDGLIDVDEFEYVLGDFGVSCKDARACFLIFSMNHEKKIDLEYFKELSAEYYRADDPGALGNFITGRLDFS
ncbi:calexcitin-2-like isoform X7 [Haliotis rufescens]|uniref:calexcitin-2-like isoform X6 n=1 Tax=Haliotis rufescens TaxID=6454 RepID=UPI00201F3846|nr:calexcitin-2-like isoform X6 [Haliotis rufescens]XP_048236717.1 calexcitin-2-like isoform X7 [Haliotis rufescens]